LKGLTILCKIDYESQFFIDYESQLARTYYFM